MDAQNSARIVYESDTVTYLRRGSLNILDALAVQLPDVFIGEILPKLDLTDTLNLSQVSKAYRDAVWSVGGVQSMEAKLDAHKAHLVKTGTKLLHTAPHPMYYAAKHGNLRAARAFLQSGPWIVRTNMTWFLNEIPPRHGWLWCNSKICGAASVCSHAALVKEMIQAGADVNMTVSVPVKDRPGKTLSNITPLFAAATQGHTPCAIELIKAGADVNIARSDGVTPLHIAAHNGHEGCVASLIQAGAVIHKVANNGYTPLSVAVYTKHEKIAALLRHFGGAR